MTPRTLALCALACAILVGCSDSTAVGTSMDARSQKMLQGIVVSGPLSARFGASASGVASDSALVYVSMFPGTLTDGDSIHVSAASGSGAFAAGPMLHGGFDPIGVFAHPSDSLDVEARGGNGKVIARVRVPGSHAPTLIRSVPARGRTDVPLNQKIIIVFSQPLDATTVDTTTVKLLFNGTTVPAAVSVLAGVPWEVELVPATELAFNSLYTVVIENTIRDVAGNPLSDVLSFDFTTTNGSGATASIAVLSYQGNNQVASDLAIAFPGNGISFEVANILANGDTIRTTSSISADWTSSDPRIATVSSLGLVTAVSPGRADIQACAGRFCGYAAVLVYAPDVGVTATNIGDLGGGRSQVMDMQGEQVVGSSARSDGRTDLFLWSKGHAMEDIGALNPDTYYGFVAVNRNGTVLTSGTSGSWIWSRETGMQPLPAPDALHRWYASALDAQGDVAFSSDSGTVIGWRSPTGDARVVSAPAASVFVHRVNDAGQVALSGSDSYYYYLQDTVAYVWDANTNRVVSKLAPRNAATGEALYIWPQAINNQGEVAGYVSIDGTKATAFRWTPASGFHYLKLADSRISTEVTGLNDAGDAVVSLVTYANASTLATSHGAVWTATGELIMLGPTNARIGAIGISNTGVVSGNIASDNTYTDLRAAFWEIGSLTASRVGAARVRAAP